MAPYLPHRQIWLLCRMEIRLADHCLTYRSDFAKKLLRSLVNQIFNVTFARKDNSLRINQLVGLLENWVMR